MVSSTEVEENLRTAGELIAQAAGRGAELAVLPEYFPIIGMSEEAKVRVRETDGEGPIQAFLAESASRHRMWIIGGTVPLVSSDPQKVRNSCLVYDDQGRRVARYDKIHLFGFQRGAENYNESKTIEPGDRAVAFDSPFGRIALSVCYDIRFPELYRSLGAVDVLAVPAAFTAPTGQAHWEVLLRARAIENQCYLIAAAQGGRHRSGRLTHGDSMIVDPWGTVLERLPSGEGVVVAEVDPAHTAEIRENLPALAHRRM